MPNFRRSLTQPNLFCRPFQPIPDRAPETTLGVSIRLMKGTYAPPLSLLVARLAEASVSSLVLGSPAYVQSENCALEATSAPQYQHSKLHVKRAWKCKPRPNPSSSPTSIETMHGIGKHMKNHKASPNHLFITDSRSIHGIERNLYVAFGPGLNYFFVTPVHIHLEYKGPHV